MPVGRGIGTSLFDAVLAYAVGDNTPDGELIAFHDEALVVARGPGPQHRHAVHIVQALE